MKFRKTLQPGPIEQHFEYLLRLRLKADPDWCFKCTDDQRAGRTIKIKNKKSGEVLQFNSVSAAARYIGRPVAQERLRLGKNLREWEVVMLEPM